MSGRRVVKRYAKALYEVAEESGELDSVNSDIKVIADLMSEPAIRGFCLRASSTAESRSQFLKIAFSPFITSSVMKNFINTVEENNREALLPYLPESYHEVLNERNNVINVVAEFASEPHEKLLSVLEEKLKKRLNSNIELIVRQNKNLLQGFRIIWQNNLLDRSAAGKLRELRKILLR